MMIIMSAVLGSARNIRHTSSLDMPGMDTSSTAMSGILSCAAGNPRVALDADHPGQKEAAPPPVGGVGEGRRQPRLAGPPPAHPEAGPAQMRAEQVEHVPLVLDDERVPAGGWRT